MGVLPASYDCDSDRFGSILPPPPDGDSSPLRRRYGISGIAGSSNVSSSAGGNEDVIAAVMAEFGSIKKSIEEGKLEIKQDIRKFTGDILLAIEKIQNAMGDLSGGSTEEIKISADKIEENFTEIKNRCAELTNSSDEIKNYVGKLVDAVCDLKKYLKNSDSPKDKTESIRFSLDKLKTSVERLVEEIRELKRSSSKSIRF
ncbi:hypothetical protein ACP275_11G108000 [Erythranthe tilingii]